MKKVQRSSFKLNPIAASIIIAMTAQFAPSLAHAGAGLVSATSAGGQQKLVNTFYANSPSGPVPQLTVDPVSGLPTTTLDPVTNLPVLVDSGKALRKFVDALPGLNIPGTTAINPATGLPVTANGLGQYIPVAVPVHNWVNPATGVITADDYYEIAAVEYSEQLHSDLPKATHLRGYVQLWTPALGALGVAAKSFTTSDGQVLSVVDNPHHLGPVINAANGTAVRVKFTNLLPVGGQLFLPVDTTITGAGASAVNDASGNPIYYTQNRAEIHLVGGQAPWISAGSPHQWVAPAGETAAYAAGLGKGASNQNVPDMADPGAGSTTLYFPNAQSARFMFYQDRTSGLTRLNSYAGLDAGYILTDTTEQGLVAAGTIPAAANTLPLIIEDKTFVPANISQQDANWDTTKWGQPGDLWFPHVYETNQDPTTVDGTNPVGRWDYGPWFWPIFPAATALPFGLGQASFTPEAYEDTPLVNGTAYPTLTVDPTAYRLRLLNASNDRFLNLGLYVADAAQNAPQLDRNGNPIVDASGNPLTFTNTEVKLSPALAATDGYPTSVARKADGTAILDSQGFPIQLPLPQYLDLATYPGNALPISGGFLTGAVPPVAIPTSVSGIQQLTPTILFSGTTRAWPTDSRIGGAPDPTTAGPDFIVIGNDGGFLPHPVDVPSQPITYEQNRRSVTVTNVYGYGLLLGPAERKDTIVDFSAYAGKTLIVYNDAPAPFPFVDGRWDYFTGDPDLTANGGAYATKPGYGPNTRTILQIKVNSTLTSGGTITPFNATALATALPAAYAASQPAPIVPAVAYNASFGTSDGNVYAHVATGSVAQPTLDFTSFTKTGLVSLGTVNAGGLNTVTVITSGGTQNPNGTIVGNIIAGSGSKYTTAPAVSFVFPKDANGNPIGSCTVPPVVGTVYVDNSSTSLILPPDLLNQVNAGAITFPTGSTYADYQIYAANHTPSYQVLGVTIAAGTGTGCSAVPEVIFSGVGIGAQATIASTVTSAPGTAVAQSIDVRTKAEQELFDNLGRYNSTGGVELPLTSDQTQTTVPLAYIDAPTEFIDDKTPNQVWKLVDNGFWSNSIHFDLVDVQLINRVGWDGTVKAPAGDEVGWKDTLRLNPLEDVVIAMRAKPGQTPFGLPQSARYQDPSVANGANGSGLGFTSDPGVVNLTTDTFNTVPGTANALLTTTTNTNVLAGSSTLNFDNEFIWGTALLGHSEDDFQRPVVYHPTVVAPTASVLTGISAATGVTLSWTDPTPAPTSTTPNATTIANPQNEFGYQVLRATITGATVGAFAQIGSAIANATSYIDTTAAAGTNYAYEVVALNAAGSTASLPYVQLATPAIPTVSTPQISLTGVVTLSWGAISGASNYLVSVNGGAGVSVTGTTYKPALALGSSYSITVAAQTSVVIGGKTYSATSGLSNAVTANLSAPAAPNAPTAVGVTGYVAQGTSATVKWTDSTTAGVTGYIVQQSVNGGAYTQVGGILAATATSAPVTVVNGNTYQFQVLAQSWLYAPTNYTNSTPATTAATPSLLTTPVAPTASAATLVSSTGLTVNWGAVTGATGYVVTRATNAGFTQGLTSTNAGNVTSLAVTGLAANTTYYFRVQATNAAGNGPVSNVVSQLTALAVAPTLNATTGVGTTGFTINWGAVTGATKYQVVVNGVTYNPTTNSQAVTGLTPNTSYTFTVAATNASGVYSTATTGSQTTVAAVLTTAPTAAAGVAGVALSWAAPTGTAAITSYTVQYATNAGFTQGTGTVTGLTSTSTTIGTGLAANTNYYFRVASVNAGGTSAYGTATGAVRTVAVPGTVAAPTAPAATIGTIGLTLNWTVPTGGPVASYTVQRATNLAFTTGVTTVATGVTATTYAVTGLTTKTTYYFRVTAVNASGSTTGNVSAAIKTN